MDLSKLKMQGSVALGTGALADILFAASLMFYLRKMRTGYRKPDSLVKSLTQYAIHTGALTSTLSILALILYIARPYTFDFMGPYFVVTKAFAVSFMCTLNTRKLMAGHIIDDDTYLGISGADITQDTPPATTGETENTSDGTGIRDISPTNTALNTPLHHTIEMDNNTSRGTTLIQPYTLRESRFRASKLNGSFTAIGLPPPVLKNQSHHGNHLQLKLPALKLKWALHS
ncbi:hypothetical protein GYMLUDRAFT_63513 [Collybiopsis luxurians FD-317 M1]|uniref:DUF6534 domain-containing protein n=1 Tax=Collybiopsis luxurians FD-317 M1 TaxID=944289 RepID=A0A0D0C7F3_9AGAR|nr:hypothetical protein GYMLUDRAFT_63513 [Collybiopsis luxurians FD-317 M1]